MQIRLLLCANNYQNRKRFEKGIEKIKNDIFATHQGYNKNLSYR